MPTPENLREAHLEDLIVEHLAGSPLYQQRESTDFDKGDTTQAGSLLDLGLVEEFLQATQSDALQKLENQFPGRVISAIADELKRLIVRRGTLELLRDGFTLRGVEIRLAWFKPARGYNESHRKKYEGNHFAVVRQFVYSVHHKNSIDLVILLNGLPIISMELKNHFTQQNVHHAMKQYREDRDPREQVLKNMLVHFAVDDDAIYMATRLKGKATWFMPFNRGLKNPPVKENFASCYLWQDILQADTLLTLIQNYLYHEKANGKDETFIFPRFHQFDVVRRLLVDASANGAGQNYLIQHSAGSGKSNSIAWLTHQLANLYDENDQKVFDTVVVITDRRVLDKQLRETVLRFQKMDGVVAKVDKKSSQLLQALESGKLIVVSTLQKYGYLKDLAAQPNRRYAVIVDEAHSSQTGEGAHEMKFSLSSTEQLDQAIVEEKGQELSDDPVTLELQRLQVARGKLSHLSFFAFTATPKQKTLETFGIPDPSNPKGFRPFDDYSMRQAIAEGYILDVLKNYTTRKTYFELVKDAAKDKRFEKKKASRLLLKYVNQHEHTIRTKSYIMLTDFVEHSYSQIAGQAKAMVVIGSRAHAVLYFREFQRILEEEPETFPFKVLVAFTPFTDKDTGEKYREEDLNDIGNADIAEAFKKPEYRILIVANKYQTGFDQPLLHTMYVDKQLGSVGAVQTLSRLNRKGPKAKQDTRVLDFVNTQQEIQAAFQDYYQTTLLDEGTDQQKLYNMRHELEAMGYYTRGDVERFIDLFVRQKAGSEKLQDVFDAVLECYALPARFFANDGKPLEDAELSEDQLTEKKELQEQQQLFRKRLRAYVRQYTFVTQIISYVDVELEKLYLFTKLLIKKLPYEPETLPLEVMEMVDMDKYRQQEEESGSITLDAEDGELEQPGGDGHGPQGEQEKDMLEVIVQELNEKFHIDFKEGDRVIQAVKESLQQDDNLAASFDNPDVQDSIKRQKLKDRVEGALIANADDFLGFLSKTEDDPAFGRFFMGQMYQWFAAQRAANRSSAE
ncbi:MAG: DEAD/DEAH box helicase family protein [Candidatus Thiodiazotropha sp. (ex Lucinoma borealis)]|nr:DEAD/DEAH box helicase family protein [Candidatus Thiodiazotropha sp. (ex Lucinoma borealis)]